MTALLDDHGTCGDDRSPLAVLAGAIDGLDTDPRDTPGPVLAAELIALERQRRPW